MASKTKKMLDWEESIKRKIVDAHRRGVCNKDGVAIHSAPSGFGHLNWCPCNFGPTRYNVWPRDAQGNLVGDD